MVGLTVVATEKLSEYREPDGILDGEVLARARLTIQEFCKDRVTIHFQPAQVALRYLWLPVTFTIVRNVAENETTHAK